MSAQDIFGRVRMGYVLVGTRRLHAWQRLLIEGLGLAAVPGAADPERGELAFAIDHHARRLILTAHDAEDVLALGWQVDDEATLATLLARCRRHRLAVQAGSAEEARLRGVAGFWRITGPNGLGIELFTQALLQGAVPAGLCSGFVTGAGGMGHVVITTREPVAMLAFWQALFDARLSDWIEARIRGVTLDIRFLRLNERHHSVAVAATRGLHLNPMRTRIQHFNLQAASFEDVSAAYQRCKALGFRFGMGMGQHSNDREISFYVISPSGFEIELGCHPIVVDEATWKTAHIHGISLWGHKPEGQTRADQLRELGQGLRSLTRAEPTVPTGGYSAP